MYFIVAAVVAGIAVMTRGRGLIVHWLTGLVVASVLTFLWFRFAVPGQLFLSFVFVVMIPVGSTFLVVSRPKLRPAVAFIAGMATYLASGALGLVVGVNVGVVMP